MAVLAMLAWPSLFQEHFVRAEEQKNFKNSHEWLWSGCKINSVKAAIALGTNYRFILDQLKEANAIYPDGTYNEKLLELLTTENEQETNNGKSSRDAFSRSKKEN